MIEKSVGIRADVYLSKYLKENGFENISRSFLQNNWEGIILVNGRTVKPSYKFRASDNVEIDEEVIKSRTSKVADENILQQKGALDIVFEDENILVVVKPKGIAMHPGVGNSKDTLANYVYYYLSNGKEYDQMLSRAGVVHRLDKAVSGLVVFAKNRKTQIYLQEQFQLRKVSKVYLAKISNDILPGSLKKYLPKKPLSLKEELEILENKDFETEDSWMLCEGYIRRSNRNRMKMRYSPFMIGGGKKAVTYVKPLDEKNLLVKIETGRMHQIRATFEYLGLKIVGDTLYASKNGGAIPKEIELESVLLSFLLPSGERLTFKLPK